MAALPGRTNPVRPSILEGNPFSFGRPSVTHRTVEVAVPPLQTQYEPTAPQPPQLAIERPPPAPGFLPPGARRLPVTPPAPAKRPSPVEEFTRHLLNPLQETVESIRQIEEASAQQRTPPENWQIQPGSPPFLIEKNSPIYDGDFITITSKAWSTGDDNGIVLRRNGEELTGDALSMLAANLRRVTVRHGQHQFLIRKVELKARKAYWALSNPELKGKIETIGWRDPFILLASDMPNLVLRTDLVDRTALARINEGKKVYFGPWPAATKEGRAQCTAGWIGNADSQCIDGLGQSVAVWYFEHPGGQFSAQSPSYVDIVEATKSSPTFVLIRNYYGLLAKNALYNGGRNLGLNAGSNGRSANLSTHNQDTDDKERWLLSTYRGDRYPVQRYNVDTTGQVIDPPGVESRTLETLNNQADPRSAWEKFFYLATGTDWLELSLVERLLIKAGGGLGLAIVALSVADKAIEHVI